MGKRCSARHAGEQEEKSEKKKVVYGKKKPGKRQDSSEVKTAEEEEREAAAAKAELEAQKQQVHFSFYSACAQETNWATSILHTVWLPGYRFI
jgi:hypothetical protein